MAKKDSAERLVQMLVQTPVTPKSLAWAWRRETTQHLTQLLRQGITPASQAR